MVLLLERNVVRAALFDSKGRYNRYIIVWH